jgi:hypothetical protein
VQIACVIGHLLAFAKVSENNAAFNQNTVRPDKHEKKAK